MDELIRTNDVVLISLVESLLSEADIGYLVADQHMSVLEGSAGFLQKRVLVPHQLVEEAREILSNAGLGQELRPPKLGLPHD